VRIAKLSQRVAVLLAFSLVIILMLLFDGDRSKAAAQSSPDAASQNATQNANQQQNRGKHAARKTSDMPGAVPGATYVGSDTCKNCHDEIYSKHFEGTPHFALLKEGAHGCEDCH
jgi:hypothetical protein